MVVRDPPGEVSSQVPGILGMNNIGSICRAACFACLGFRRYSIRYCLHSNCKCGHHKCLTVLLHHCRQLRSGCVVSMPAGFSEGLASIATTASQADAPPDPIEAINLSVLPTEGMVQALLRQYASMFSRDDFWMHQPDHS